MKQMRGLLAEYRIMVAQGAVHRSMTRGPSLLAARGESQSSVRCYQLQCLETFPICRNSQARALMIIGVIMLQRESHGHLHTHEIIFHNHLHLHGEHHQHEHLANYCEPHSHPHGHGALAREHPHVSDIHHRHKY
jgi:hypothetical protein